MAFLVTLFAISAACLAFDDPPQLDPWALSEPERSIQAHDESDESSFFVLPIRTELQRQLIAGGKPADVLVELNGFVAIGKRGIERMRALDILALRRSLAAIKAANPKASVVFVIGFLGQMSPDTFRLLSNEQKLLTQECDQMAKDAKLHVTRISGTTAGTPGLWPKTIAAAKDIDLTKETATESAVGDSEVRAFPVRTRITRLLTGDVVGTPHRSDCVVYIDKRLKAANNPLISPELEAHIKQLVSKLELPSKDRIDFHLFPAGGSGKAYLKNREAIDKRFLGTESQRLAKSLGFKDSSVTY